MDTEKNGPVSLKKIKSIIGMLTLRSSKAESLQFNNKVRLEMNKEDSFHRGKEVFSDAVDKYEHRPTTVYQSTH